VHGSVRVSVETLCAGEQALWRKRLFQSAGIDRGRMDNQNPLGDFTKFRGTSDLAEVREGYNASLERLKPQEGQCVDPSQPGRWITHGIAYHDLVR
jgi:hypothetical protein